METNLRPLTLGEILDRTAQLYRTNFLLFAGIFAIYSGIALVLSLGHLGIVEALKAAHMMQSLRWVSIGFSIVQLLVLFLLLGAAMAAICKAVASVHLGESITIRSAYSSTLPRLGRYLWLMTITFFMAWLPVVLVWGTLFGLIMYLAPNSAAGHAAPTAAASPAPQQLAMVGIVFLGFAILMLPFAIYTIWMSVRYSLAIPVCVVEQVKARQAIRRSISLSKGARWRIFALGLLVVVIKFGLVGLSQSFVFILVFKHHGQISVGINVLSQIVGFFLNSFLGPIGVTGLTLFYYDQRVRTEGYDIEWMMRQAGMNPELTPTAVTGSETATVPDEAPAAQLAAMVQEIPSEAPNESA